MFYQYFNPIIKYQNERKIAPYFLDYKFMWNTSLIEKFSKYLRAKAAFKVKKYRLVA